MTDSPPPSDRPRTAKSLAFALFRPVLFAVGVIGLALGGLVLSHRSNPEIAALPPPTQLPIPVPVAPSAPIVLAEPEAVPPIAPSDFRTFSADLRGFSMKPPEPNSEPEPPAPDRYELTLRLEKGDTVDKMLADIDVPQADRKQIHERLAALLKKKRLAAGEEIFEASIGVRRKARTTLSPLGL